MNKSRRSVLTAISSIALTVISGLFSLFITKYIIIEYGSDFNGLNSTANQFVSMLLIIEGGFTIASNVALFKPIAINDYDGINKILSGTRKIFNKIGCTFFIIGIATSVIFALIINSELSPIISFSVFIMTIISATFNLSYGTKYRILLQSENKEYILNGIQIITSILSNLLIIVTVLTHGHMLLVRFFTMLGAIINSLLIASITKKKYEHINFNEEPDYKSISGTKDLFMQKITGVIYSTIPILFISGTAGTIYASIYFVYNNIFHFLKSMIYAFLNSARMGFGKLIAEKDSDYVLKVFLQYEFITNFVMLTLLSVASVLIMPFIKIYTDGITDANYYNWEIALILILTAFFEIIHIPSGNIINMAGKFKVGRKIQIAASIFLIVTMMIGYGSLGFYGTILAVLATAILLAVFEVLYIHNRYFKGSTIKFLRLIVPNVVVMIIITSIEMHYLAPVHNYIEFCIAGVFLVVINAIVLAITNLLINKDIMIGVIDRLKSIIAIKNK